MTKKNWTNPELESLKISETAGGMIFSTDEDSDYFVNSKGNWAKRYGYDEEYISGDIE